jgi:Ala-tRNA(Pro) deacylase
MAIHRRLQNLLDDARVPYQIYSHALAYTAQEIAAKQHISGDLLAKVVMLQVDGKLIMAVVRGNDKVNPHVVEESLDARHVRLAAEDEFVARFPDCEIGAEPPFGNLFGLTVYVDTTLAKDEEIYFNAGNHAQTLKMKYRDYAELVKPQVVPLTGTPNKFAA